MRLSIVIPALDEAPQLRRFLGHAVDLADQVCLSDGGSGDDTRLVAEEFGVLLVEGETQRGGQLNRGAQATQGDILLFLHADTRLPPEAPDRIREAIVQGAVGGGFRLRFDTDRPVMGRLARFINWRTRWTRCPLGDQAQFVRRDVFEALGGYPEWPILEDLNFVRRLKKRGPTVLLDPPVVTSPRRYLKHGILRTLCTNALIFTLYFAGASPHRLARLYHHIR